MTISTLLPSFSSVSFCTSSLVFGASSSMPFTTERRSVRASSDNIACIAPRYILRFTFCVKSRGFAANARPPPTQIGLRIEPARAWPVPFWRHGLMPPPRTSAFVFCALVPARPPAMYATTTWCTSDSLYSRQFVIL
jgi:hypothetical protein